MWCAPIGGVQAASMQAGELLPEEASCRLHGAVDECCEWGPGGLGQGSRPWRWDRLGMPCQTASQRLCGSGSALR